jgi:hypothetical protein
MFPPEACSVVSAKKIGTYLQQHTFYAGGAPLLGISAQFCIIINDYGGLERW